MTGSKYVPPIVCPRVRRARRAFAAATDVALLVILFAVANVLIP